MLTPADIDTKQFSTTRLKEGYVQEEVDDFLDRVQEDFKFLTTQVARLELETVALRRNLARATSEAPTTALPPVAEPPSLVAQKLLEAAEKAAQEHKADTLADADRIIREAGSEAARLVEEAHAAAEKIKNDGLAEKYRRNEELDNKITSARQTYADIRSNADRIASLAAEAVAAHRREFGE